MFQVYKKAYTKPFKSCLVLDSFDEFHVTCQKEDECFTEFENIDDIYQQIEICWKTIDYEPLIEILQQFRNWIDRNDFQFTDSFFKNEIDSILYKLIFYFESNDQEDKCFYDTDYIDDFSKSILQNLSISIIHDLFVQFFSYFSTNSLLNFINLSMSSIESLNNDLLIKTLDCLRIIYDKNMYLLQNCFDCSFFLKILDKWFKYQSNHKSNYTLFYDGDEFDRKSALIMSILLKLPPNIEIISLFINNGNCGLKRFTLFLWFLIKNPSFIPNFDPSLYLPKIYEIISKSHDYSLIFPSIIFLSNICDKIKINDIIILLFPLIKNARLIDQNNINDNSLNKSFTSCLYPETEANSCNFHLDISEDAMITKICSISLFCLSRFVSSGPNETVFCIENGIISIILGSIDAKSSQNQIKREASRLLCRIIFGLSEIPSMAQIIKEFYKCEEIIDLLLNVLEYDEPDMDELILKSLIFLMKARIDCLSMLNAKCSESSHIFIELLNNENSEISALACQMIDLCKSSSGDEYD